MILSLFAAVGCNDSAPLGDHDLKDVPVDMAKADVAPVDAAPVVEDAAKMAQACTTGQANVLLVLDKSGSMTTEVTKGFSKFKLMHEALDEITTGPSVARFGLSLFAHGTSTDTCDAGRVDVAFADDSGEKIRTTIAPYTDAKINDESVGTPIAGTLKALHAAFTDTTRPNALVLYTDGNDTCADNGRKAVRDQITALTAAKVKVFIVTAQKDKAKPVAVLNDWADAAGTALTGDRHYYDAASVADLKTTLTTIASSLTTPCSGIQ